MQPFTFFISYRRQDTAPIALLLKHEIEKRLQFVRVFVDVENLRVGTDFPDEIRQMIAKSHATIALIGKQWMNRRKDVKEDWVIEELRLSKESRLEYKKADCYGLRARKIVPLFFDIKKDFRQFDLHEQLKGVSQKHACQINYSEWPNRIGSLVQEIVDGVCPDLKERQEKYEDPPPCPEKDGVKPLGDQELSAILQLSDYSGWYIDNFGENEDRRLVKRFEFPHFNQAADFMKAAADQCRLLNHHPEWKNVFKYVTVSLSTYAAKRRITIYDTSLALFMNKLAKIIDPHQ